MIYFLYQLITGRQVLSEMAEQEICKRICFPSCSRVEKGWYFEALQQFQVGKCKDLRMHIHYHISETVWPHWVETPILAQWILLLDFTVFPWQMNTKNILLS